MTTDYSCQHHSRCQRILGTLPQVPVRLVEKGNVSRQLGYGDKCCGWAIGTQTSWPHGEGERGQSSGEKETFLRDFIKDTCGPGEEGGERCSRLISL